MNRARASLITSTPTNTASVHVGGHGAVRYLVEAMSADLVGGDEQEHGDDHGGEKSGSACVPAVVFRRGACGHSQADESEQTRTTSMPDSLERVAIRAYVCP
jgi:hypothetical protein